MLRRMRSKAASRSSLALCCGVLALLPSLLACTVSRTPRASSEHRDSDGPCAPLFACCTLQGDRAGDCIDDAVASSLAGEQTCIDSLSNPEVVAHNRVPCDTSAAYAEAIAREPGARPLVSLDGPREPTTQIADDAVGSACTTDFVCGGGTCDEQTALHTPFPDGYCSGRCYEDETCGAGGWCVLPAGWSEPGHCYQRCANDEGCPRDGYRCTPLGDGERVVGACYPRRDALPDGVVGTPCTQDAECAGGAAVCFGGLHLSSSDDELVPARGGYCSTPCLFDVDCGENAQCVSGGTTGGQCMARCDARAPCRDGYECVAHLRDRDPAATVCMPIWIAAP
jgi:hypothetical protein